MTTRTRRTRRTRRPRFESERKPVSKASLDAVLRGLHTHAARWAAVEAELQAAVDAANGDESVVHWRMGFDVKRKHGAHARSVDVERLAELSGKSQSTVRKALRELERAGVVQGKRTYRKGCVYRLLDDAELEQQRKERMRDEHLDYLADELEKLGVNVTRRGDYCTVSLEKLHKLVTHAVHSNIPTGALREMFAE